MTREGTRLIAEDATIFTNWFIQHLLDPLGLFGLAAQAMFMLRFVVQWFASERRKRSYVPVAFWYFSLAGGLMTFTYAYLRREPVFMLAQALGLTIYVRNLVLIYRRRWRYQQRRSAEGGSAAAGLNAQEPAAVQTTDT